MRNTFLNKISKIFYFSLFMFFSCGPTPKSEPDLNKYQFKETRDLVNFVSEAADEFSKKGTDAFNEFGTEGSKWFSGTKYIFIYNLSGECIFHPVLKKFIVNNLIGRTDMNGKPIGKFIASIAANTKKPYGWIHYLWAEPGEIFPSWKNAYIIGVKGPDGNIYAIGSGTYNIRTEIPFVVDVVDSAAELVHKEGREAYPELLDNASIFYFYNTYIFVLSTRGQLLVDPSFPTNIGRNVIDFKDYNGHFIIREIIEKLNKEDVAYVSYMWPAPGQANPSKKMIYARKVVSGVDTVIVGSSLFLMEPIWKKF